MPDYNFRVRARIRSSNPAGIRGVLEEMFGEDALSDSAEHPGELLLEAETRGESMKSLNRSLLSRLRKVEKRTTIRTEWTGQSMKECYFDYVLKRGENL